MGDVASRNYSQLHMHLCVHYMCCQTAISIDAQSCDNCCCMWKYIQINILISDTAAVMITSIDNSIEMPSKQKTSACVHLVHVRNVTGYCYDYRYLGEEAPISSYSDTV